MDNPILELRKQKQHTDFTKTKSRLAKFVRCLVLRLVPYTYMEMRGKNKQQLSKLQTQNQRKK